jgi:hypothetical protein
LLRTPPQRPGGGDVACTHRANNLAKPETWRWASARAIVLLKRELRDGDICMRTLGRTLAVALAALALVEIATPAEANPYYRRRYTPPSREAAAPITIPDGPLQLVVSIGSQKIFVYSKDGLVESSIVSTGVGGFPTPTGVFAVLEKSERHFSNIYGGAPMPFMQRLTMSGVALHSGMVTGRPASHGCIRLPHAFAIKLFKMTKLGVRVVIVPNEPTPEEIAHPALFTHKPASKLAPDEMSEGPEKTAAIAAAVGRDMEKGVMLARIGKITAWRMGELQKLPVSVFVSKAEGRVFVRHGFSQVLDAPAVIRDPDRLIGTHVFTALEQKGGTGEMRWNVLTLPKDNPAPVVAETNVRGGRYGYGRPRSQPAPVTPAAVASGPPSTASEALDRIELPQEVRDRVAPMIGAGASLIISDHGISREMRVSGTDFVVLTR